MTVHMRAKNAENKTNEWMAFWDQPTFWTYPELFQVNARLFKEQTSSLLNYNPDDRVLNIGCGPGYLDALLSKDVQSVLAADTSSGFLEVCRQNNATNSNVRVERLPEDYTNLTQFNETFSLFLCISIIQYYKDIDEVAALILSAKKIARPGARMLIADMPRERNFIGSVWDASCSFWQSLTRGYAGTLIGKAWREKDKIAKYRLYAKQTPHLILKEKDFQGLIERLNLDADVLKTNVSICANRLSLLIRF